LPPAYPIGSARLAGSVVGSSAPVAAPSAVPVENEAKVCRSPVSGIVVKLVAQPGQSLQVGDSLMVLEAMKMETNITAPVAGKVATIKVKPGDTVQADEVVVEFE
jgi:methylmalonyl-CoA carboxyltransferase small subunit